MDAEVPRLDRADIERVVELTSEVCELNDAIRRLHDEPAARIELIARRDELIAQLVGRRKPVRRSRSG